MLFFGKKVLLGALSFLFCVPKAAGSGLSARPTAIRFDMKARPKSFPKGVGFGLVAKPIAMEFDLQLDSQILGLTRQLDLQNAKYVGLRHQKSY